MGLTVPSRLIECFYHLIVRGCADQPVRHLGSQLCRFRPRGCHIDGRELFRERINARIPHRVIRSAVGIFFALPQVPNDLNGFCQHFLAGIDIGPRIVKHVFVQVFTRAEPQEKTTRHHIRHCRGGMRSQHGMKTNDRASHTRAHAHTLCSLGNASKYTPDEGAVSLPRHPGMEMVGDQEELKPDLFCHLGIRNQPIRAVFLTRQGIS